MLINNSIELWTYPSKLKLAKVIPIFKSGDKSGPPNYRPISLLYIFNRIFEKIANSYQHRTNDLLTRSSKTNYERTTGELTIWLTKDDRLTVTIGGSKRTSYWLRVFIANNITA